MSELLGKQILDLKHTAHERKVVLQKSLDAYIATAVKEWQADTGLTVSGIGVRTDWLEFESGKRIYRHHAEIHLEELEK